MIFRNFIENINQIPSKVFYGIVSLITLLLFVVFSQSVSASTVSIEHTQESLNLIDLWQIIMAAKDDLPWYQIMILAALGASPIASIFVSLTPTPKSGTLWSFVYKYLEATAFNFHRAKDKPVDTHARLIDGKPLDIAADSSHKLESVKTIAKDEIQKAAGKKLLKFVPKLLKSLF